MTYSYISIASCARCGRIPQKMTEDFNPEGMRIVPPEVSELRTVLDMQDAGTHRYACSTTRLLKCDLCGTYYYYNRYEDDGEYVMDPKSDTVTVRRYDPLAVRDFLERLLAGPDNVLPNAPAQLTKAFVDNDYSLETKVIVKDYAALRDAVREELLELDGRMDALMDDCASILRDRVTTWHVQRYAFESVFARFVVQGDWDSLSRELLHHPDPGVRLAAAQLAVGIGTGDAPVYDILHATRAMRDFLESEVAKKDRKDELVTALLELALHDHGNTLRYEHGYGNSQYDPASIRMAALYCLVVLAGHRANLFHAIPSLVALLSRDTWLNRQVCWVLQTIVEKRKKGAPLVLEELEKLRTARKAVKSIFKDGRVAELIGVCEKRLSK